MTTKSSLRITFAVMVLCLVAGELRAAEETFSVDPNNPPIYFSVFEGSCKSLIIEDLPTKVKCAPILMVSKFQSGGAVFILQQIKASVIAFHGAKLNELDAAYQVYSVSINKKERRATGRCDLTIISQGSGSLKCEAAIDGERYSTDFVIDRTKKVLEK